MKRRTGRARPNPGLYQALGPEPLSYDYDLDRVTASASTRQRCAGTGRPPLIPGSHTIREQHTQYPRPFRFRMPTQDLHDHPVDGRTLDHRGVLADP